MHDPYVYALEKYSVAVHGLVGAEDVRVGLKEAYMAILPVEASQLPEHVRDEHSG